MNQLKAESSNVMNIEMAMETLPTNSIQRKQVDYYLNPTELFRWMNYRRWDGAKARALSHPDECSTWIVSKHNTDGRVLWSHLPLHLACMQNENGSNEAQNVPGFTEQNRQIAELVDVLLEVYPDGAKNPDDQGMLPLHHAINGTTINERILNLLLLIYPSGVNVKNKVGLTPIDLLKGKTGNDTNCENMVRVMKRAQKSIGDLKQKLRDENHSHIESVKQSAENERTASQRILMRLEEEIASLRQQKDEVEIRSRHEEGSSNQLKSQIQALNAIHQKEGKFLDDIKGEKDELMNQNEVLRTQVQEHEQIVKTLHRQIENKNQDRSDIVAKLKSECSTAKAMANALESQLRSRFTNEEYLTNSVMELETQLNSSKNEYENEKSKLIHDRNAFENENMMLERTTTDLTKKNQLLHSKLAEVNKEMSTVLASHGALNAEHDRMMDINLRVESDLIEGMRAERDSILDNVRKQWKFFENAFQNQKHFIEDSQEREDQVLNSAKAEREKSFENIKSMRQDFLEARASALDRQMVTQGDKIYQIALSSDSEKQYLNSAISIADNGSLDRSSTMSSHLSATKSKRKKKTSRASKSPSSSIGRKIETFSSSEVMESRLPPLTHVRENTSFREDPMSTNEELDGNFLRLLEKRTKQGKGILKGRRDINISSSVSLESTTSSSPLTSPREHEKKYGTIKLLNMPKSNLSPSFSRNFGSNNTGESSSMQSNTTRSKTTKSSDPDVAKTLRKLHNLTLDTIPQSMGYSR